MSIMGMGKEDFILLLRRISLTLQQVESLILSRRIGCNKLTILALFLIRKKNTKVMKAIKMVIIVVSTWKKK